MDKIKELLEIQTAVSDIACELYGDMYVTNEKFWGSPTEKQLREVTEQLFDAGYEWEPTQNEIEQAEELFKDMGLDDYFEDDEDESWI